MIVMLSVIFHVGLFTESLWINRGRSRVSFSSFKQHGFIAGYERRCWRLLVWLRMQLGGRLCVWRTRPWVCQHWENKSDVKHPGWIHLNKLCRFVRELSSRGWRFLLEAVAMTAGSRLVLSLLQFVPTKGCSVSSLILSLIYFQVGVEFESRCSLLTKPKSY